MNNKVNYWELSANEEIIHTSPERIEEQDSWADVDDYLKKSNISDLVTAGIRFVEKTGDLKEPQLFNLSIAWVLEAYGLISIDTEKKEITFINKSKLFDIDFGGLNESWTWFGNGEYMFMDFSDYKVIDNE